MLRDSFFRIFLHLVVQRGIDSKAVLVQIVFGTVRLYVLVKPAVERVVRPQKRIRSIVFPICIFGTHRLISIHHTAEHVAEIRSQTGIMVLNLIGQCYRNFSYRISLSLSQIPGLFHLADHEIPPDQGLVRVQCRIISCRLVHHSDQCRALLDGQLCRFLGKERLGCRPYTVGAASEEDSVQIHVQNLFLCIVALQLHGRYPFLQLYPYHLHLGKSRDAAGDVSSRIESLGKLLGDGTSSSLAGIAQEQCLH